MGRFNPGFCLSLLRVNKNRWGLQLTIEIHQRQDMRRPFESSYHGEIVHAEFCSRDDSCEPGE